jgi:uncharacterized protein YaaN involved in tellurite resistance
MLAPIATVATPVLDTVIAATPDIIPAQEVTIISNTTSVAAIDAQNVAAQVQTKPVTAEDRTKIETYKKELIVGDSQRAIGFGVEDQRNVTQVSEQMLTGVRAKDTGSVGDVLVNMVTTMRGLDIGVLDPNKKKGGIGSWFKAKITPIVMFAEQYETISSQVAVQESTLTTHRMTLVRDMTMLDKLYDATLNFFHALDLRIVAITERIEEINDHDIPAAQSKMTASGDMLDAQALRDLTAYRDDLERKRTDLLLTRQVALQTLPSIRLMQENDKGLCNKIQSQIINGVPLWKNQIAIAISLYKQQEATKALTASTDFTNDMLRANANALKQGTADVRNAMERGVFDIEAVKYANDQIIGSIQEAIMIAEQGKIARAKVEQELVTAESKLKSALIGQTGRNTTVQGRIV